MSCNRVTKFPIYIDCNGDPNGNGTPIEISYISFANKGEIAITTSGTHAIIPLATASIAGLMTPAQFLSLKKVDISTQVSNGDTTINISGNTRCGYVEIITGSSGQAGTVFVYDISSHIQSGAILVFSDMLDNYAMGHYQVGYMYLDSSNRMVFKVKEDMVLEPNTTYKWAYHIQS